MATSGTSTFNANRNELIRQAGLKVGAVKPNQVMGSQVISDFEFALNSMVKRWQAKSIHVCTITEATLFPVADQVEYQLGPSSTDHCASSYVETEISADEASGQTALSVEDDDGIANGDYLGVQLDDGTIHWTTVSGTPSGNVVTAALALTDTASAGNKVFAYTSNITRPTKIVPDSGRLYNVSTRQESNVAIVARGDYRRLTDKYASGTVSQLFYDPQLSTGIVSLWQAPQNPLELVKFTWWRPIQDFNTAGDNPDLPAEWIDAIVFNLAVMKAPDYNVPTEKYAIIKQQADQYFDDVSGFDREQESIFFGVDMSD